MTEKELYEKIRSSAKEIEVPESLSPENMKKKLDAMVLERADENKGREDKNESQEEKNKSDANVKQKRIAKWGQGSTGRKIVAAAAVLLVCTAGVSTMYRLGSADGEATGSTAEGIMTDAAEYEETLTEGAVEDAAGSEAESLVGDEAESPVCDVTESDAAGASATGNKADAGKLYVVAEDYGEVYDILQAKEDTYYLYSEAIRGADQAEETTVESDSMATGTTDAAVSSTDMAAGTADNADIASNTLVDMGMTTDSGMKESAVEDAEAANQEGYSKTNLQTAGVDESDIIKTDGAYIYVVDEDVVKIVDIRNSKMEVIGEIGVTMNSASDQVVEMYVDGDILNLIVEREDTRLQQEKKQSNTKKISATNQGNSVEDVTYDVYVINSDRVTELFTYDISNRTNPKLLGSVSQDGYYKTSRKIGDIVYLFTQKELQMPNLTREEAMIEENAGDWIPLVNGSAIDAECIYVPKEGNSGLIISTVNVENPKAVVDNTLIMNNYVNIYVSTGAIYLYGTDYASGNVKTQIAKFSLEDGVIDAVGATSAAGEVYDTFAINDNQGKLRLLTTDWSGEEEQNRLYLFDEKLKLTGSLKGIAKGEQIYSARYLGDIVYFVTYRNTDPLFAVDLSDEKNPKILSELKITGFSEYLHFWGEDKLLGIGYETDPDSGMQLGLKITMFDISNPADLKVAGSCVIEDVDYSPALYNYKCVLADAEENLIGFATKTYGRTQDYNYLLFAWEDGAFQELLTEGLKTDLLIDEYRGLYVGDTFYLANTDWITSYNREDAYKKIQSLEL